MTQFEYSRRHLALRNAYIDGEITWDELDRAVAALNREAGLA